ncbi:Ribosome biogenesis protein WDR12 [Fasciola hepatica]|uniref:Ribosome biogenesis protein WDR12 n=1 Tax=Fasciola hepatica TaxID=6192 RepID=A0A4E0RX33_FASHE|nr:Ribosome biogenesis protein WDR12 [Fasciola hepatica]
MAASGANLVAPGTATCQVKRYPVSSAPISVPSSSSRKELNDVINQLLEDTDKHPVTCEFDFLINNEFLTSTLNEYVQEKQLSLELIEIDALTGSYDHTVQVWDLCNSSCVFRMELDEKVKCVEWLEFVKIVKFLFIYRSDPDEGHRATFVTGGFDQSAYLWTWDTKTDHVKCVANCRGHSETVMTVASAPQSSKLSTRLFATGSWDGTIKLWSSDPEESDLSEETGGIGHTRKSSNKIPTRIPRMTLAGHRETVTRICWLNNQSQKQSNPGAEFQLVSVGWDHTLRLWDCQVESGSQTEALALIGFQGHTAWLTSIAWAPHRDNQFVTGSVDRSVRLWDTRNTRGSLYDLMGHSDMVTSVDWAPPTKLNKKLAAGDSESDHHFILSASADGTVKVYDYPNCE